MRIQNTHITKVNMNAVCFCKNLNQLNRFQQFISTLGNTDCRVGLTEAET
jgi:hypothetical protein